MVRLCVFLFCDPFQFLNNAIFYFQWDSISKCHLPNGDITCGQIKEQIVREYGIGWIVDDLCELVSDPKQSLKNTLLSIS